jgi:uncharacterized metal-binding protein YceD (DUF177 family)
MAAPPVPFSHPIDATALPAKGRVYDLEADAAARARIARALGLESLDRLTAHLAVTPGRGGSVEVAGSFAAEAVQACVVSLQPVPARLAQDIARRFVAAPESPVDKKNAAPEAEGWVDPDGEVADPLLGGTIDLGDIVTEELALALDPYPRAPGVAFAGIAPAAGAASSESEAGPFAALAALKGGRPARRRAEAGRGAGPKASPKGPSGKGKPAR